jgi:hypothetical protein
MNNNDEIYLNDVVMEEEYEIQPSLQIKKIINIDEGEERIKENLKICIFKKKVET